MMKKVGILFLMLFVLGIAFASPADTNNTSFMNSRFDKITCDATFSIADASNLKAVDANDSVAIDSAISPVTNDLSSLKTAINITDKNAFNAQAVTTLGDIKTLNQLTKSTMQNALKKPADMNVRRQLRTQDQAARAQFVDCVKSAFTGFVQAKINSFNNILDSWDKKISALQDKNINVDSMNQVVAQARTSVITPLQNAIASGDINAIKAAAQNNCLYDGCQTGNFHFAAKIEAAKLGAILTKLQPLADANYSADWQAAEASLTTANTNLATVGSDKYTQTTNQSVWSNLKDCASKTNQLLNELKAKKGGNTK